MPRLKAGLNERSFSYNEKLPRYKDNVKRHRIKGTADSGQYTICCALSFAFCLFACFSFLYMLVYGWFKMRPYIKGSNE
jgi:ABC-type multidrug transport system permease subunit